MAAAAHYHMGGVETDLSGRSSLPGLWVCGEAASTGLHGGNRLASNGLLEALVFAARATADIARAVPGGDAPALDLAFPPDGLPPPNPQAMAALRRIMTEQVGVVRDGAGLTAALDGIARLASREADPALANSLAAATLIAAAALRREESRGAHFRSDFPEMSGAARRSRLTLAEARALRDGVAA